MSIWIPFFAGLWQLRPAFPRLKTFLFFCAAVVAVCTRNDLRGVTSFVRGLFLAPPSYFGFLRMFHCRSLDPGKLSDAWTSIVFKIFSSHIVRFQGRVLLAADGLKIPKEARRMPAVRSLHQESSSNTKPEWIMGHYFQVISVLVQGAGRFFAVPLSARIHDGIRSSNRESKSLLDKLCLEMFWLPLPQNFILVADSYYAAKSFVSVFQYFGCCIVSQVRMNAVARNQPLLVPGRRGRKPKYGSAVKLRELFGEEMSSISVDLYGKKSQAIRIWTRELLWQNHGQMVKFVGTIMPDGRRAILMSTDLNLTAKEIIEIYSLRIRIEQSFKVAVRTLGSFAYHFWSKAMDKIKPRSKGQFLHKKTSEYRARMNEKLASCERFVFVGVVAQGLLQYLSVCYPQLVWKNFNGWYRSLLTTDIPTEEVTSNALKSRLSELWLGSTKVPEWTKFICEDAPYLT